MDSSARLSFMNPFILGMVGGAFSTLLMMGSFILFMPQLRGKSYEIVTVDQQALKQRFSRILAEQNLNPSQEAHQIHLFWRTTQEKIHSLQPGKTTIVLARESTLNMDLKDVTEALWKDAIRTLNRDSDQGGRR